MTATGVTAAVSGGTDVASSATNAGGPLVLNTAMDIIPSSGAGGIVSSPSKKTDTPAGTNGTNGQTVSNGGHHHPAIKTILSNHVVDNFQGNMNESKSFHVLN